MKKFYYLFKKLTASRLSILVLFFSVFIGQKMSAQVDITATVGTPTSSYTTLNAAFTAINSGTHQGVIGISITGDTNEGATTALLNASGSGSALYSAITISPSGGVTRTISGATTAGAPMIDLSGADNVTFNGINSGGNNLIIANTTVSATSGTSTIRFIGGATNNIITNCSIQGSSTMLVNTNGGNINFSTDAVTANGNDNNTISNCDIGPAGINLPTKGIYANGSTTTTLIGNSGNTITNNTIHDFFGAAVTSSGISLQGGCNTWTITNNKLYQTATRTWTTGATHRGIEIINSTTTSGNQGHTVTGNIVGYSSSTQTGVYALTGSTGKFQGIYYNGITTGIISNVNNNTVSSVSLTGVTSSGTSTTSPFVGILIANGLANTNNNTIGSQNSTGSLVFSTNSTTATDVIGIYNFSSDDWTANNNTVGGLSVTNTAASGTYIVYGMRANTSTTKLFNGSQNSIGGTVANSIQLTATGVASQIIGIHSSNAGLNLTSNTIRNLTNNIGTGTTTTASVIGINATTATPNHLVSNNTIYNLANTNATAANVVTGIQFTGATANVVERNLIYDLTVASNSATAEVNGIRIGGGTTIYRNNMIRIGNGIPNAVLVSGINEFLGTNSVFHNSIYIGGAPTTGTANSFAFNGQQTVNVRSFRNNIFFNARSNSGATGKNYIVRVGGTTPNPTGLTINNNVYFANGTGSVFGLFNALDVADLASWKTAVGQDANSFNLNPEFNNAIAPIPDLHLHPTNSTVAEGNGFDVGVALDFDGETRSGLTPTDIGADAGNYVGVDLSGPAITYTVLPFICSTGDRSLNGVVIADNTGVPTTGVNQPRIYYRKNAGTWFSSQGTIASGTATNGTWNFSIIAADMGGLILGDNVQYYVVAQDLAALPNISSTPAGVIATDVNTITTHPVTPNNYNISQSLNGNYTVGVAGNFSTLTAAVNAYNNGCITGAVVFELVDATYPSETFPITIIQNASASAINTLTIKPAVGVTPTISGSLNGAVFILNGADYVNINGSSTLGSAASCLVGGDATLRQLTFQNTNVGTSAAVIAVQSGTNGAQNNSIKNITVIGQDPTTTLIGISLGGNTPGTAGTDNDNNLLENCSVQKAIFGIYSVGASLANQNSGTIIKQNDLSSTGVNRIRRIGIMIFNDNGANISFNNVGGIDTSETSDAIGIALGIQNVVNSATAAGGVTNALVTNNKVNGVSNDNTYSAAGIAIAGDVVGYNTISNNMISNVISDGNSGDLVAGIFVTGVVGSDTRLYNNTVTMSGDRSALLSAGTLMYPSYGIAITNTDPIVDLRNNIIVNSQFATVGTNPDAKAYALGINSTTFVNLNSNYNNFISSGVLAGGFRSGSLATAAGTNYATLALWAAAVADDANSVEIAPVFVSASDLHLIPASNVSLDNLGTPIAAVTTDYDCGVRSATPDMGADEFCLPSSNSTTIVACDSYTWSVNGTNYTTSGTYTSVVGCLTETLNLTINNTPNADAPANVIACDSYTLPALTVGNYFTGIGGAGTALSAGANITSTQTIYVYAQTGTIPNCTDENSFSVTITPSSSLPNEVVSVCDSYTWAANGTTYTTSGTYTNVVNCVTRTLNLTITPSSSLPNEVVSVCDSYTWAANGTTYTTSGTYTNVVNCVTRTLNLTITSATISGITTQVINGGVAADATIEDIVVTSNGTVTWFASSSNATSNLNPLPAGTQLVNGNIYYGVTNIGSCRSTTLAVTVTVVLGNTTFDLSQLEYYPNPVKDIFNVKYNKEIISVDVYDLTGRKVIEMKPNTLEVQLNMTNLSSAMYIVRLLSVDGITELKVYKN